MSGRLLDEGIAEVAGVNYKLRVLPEPAITPTSRGSISPSRPS